MYLAGITLNIRKKATAWKRSRGGHYAHMCLFSVNLTFSRRLLTAQARCSITQPAQQDAL